MARPRIHLVIRRSTKVRAVCGVPDPQRYTRNQPALVTCKACTGSLPMADLELAQRQSTFRASKEGFGEETA